MNKRISTPRRVGGRTNSGAKRARKYIIRRSKTNLAVEDREFSLIRRDSSRLRFLSSPGFSRLSRRSSIFNLSSSRRGFDNSSQRITAKLFQYPLHPAVQAINHRSLEEKKRFECWTRKEGGIGG